MSKINVSFLSYANESSKFVIKAYVFPLLLMFVYVLNIPNTMFFQATKKMSPINVKVEICPREKVKMTSKSSEFFWQLM